MKKLYYSIGEVSEITGVEPHVLRYWETIFDELSPGKNSGGKRIYKEEHLNVALRLKELIREQQYSTAGAKQILREDEEQDESADAQAPAMDLSLKRDLKEIRYFLNGLLERL
jgi:DNA-binding transcriptional MerR regulator